MPRFLTDLTEPGGGLDDDGCRDCSRAKSPRRRNRGDLQRDPSAPQGSNRVLMLRGQRAPDQVASPGSAVLWVFDATDMQVEIERLHRRGRAPDTRL